MHGCYAHRDKGWVKERQKICYGFLVFIFKNLRKIINIYLKSFKNSKRRRIQKLNDASLVIDSHTVFGYVTKYLYLLKFSPSHSVSFHYITMPLPSQPFSSSMSLQLCSQKHVSSSSHNELLKSSR